MLKEETTLLNRFTDFHDKNPEVYELFVRFTFEAIKRGHKRLSAWMITNRIRWETTVVTVNCEYKVSNDYIALYSRKFMRDYPQYDGFFKAKEMKRA